MINTKSTLRTLIAGAFFTFAATAQAAPGTFGVDPTANGLGTPISVIPGSGAKFEANSIYGRSSARVQREGTTDTYTSKGYIRYDSFSFDVGDVSNVIDSTKSLLGVDGIGYDLYAVFDQTFTCTGGLTVDTKCSIDKITLSLFADKGSDVDYLTATLDRDATVTGGGDQLLLGTVSKVNTGSAGFNEEGGAFQNVNTDLTLTDEGKAFFYSPNPFYTFAYSAFNNTTQGVTCDDITCAMPSVVAINQETGITDFNGLPAEVPEPGSLALLGLGLLGLTAYRRKQAQK